MNLRALARRLGKTESMLSKEIDELIECDFLKKDGDAIYDPWMVADKKASDSKKSRGQLSSNDDGSNLKANPEYLDNEGVAPQTDQSKNDFNYHPAEKSRAEEIKVNSALANAFAGKTASAPSGAAVPSAFAGGITDAEIAQLKRNPKYAGKDVDEVIRKCREHYPDEPITLKMVRGWLKRERNTATVNPADRVLEERQNENGDYEYWLGDVNVTDAYGELHLAFRPDSTHKEVGRLIIEGLGQGPFNVASALKVFEESGDLVRTDKGWRGLEWSPDDADESEPVTNKPAAAPTPPEPAPAPAPAAYKPPKHRFTAAPQPADGSDEDEEEECALAG